MDSLSSDALGLPVPPSGRFLAGGEEEVGAGACILSLPLPGELPWCSRVLQSVVMPRCRGTAEALQITVGHILGDAGSPYLIGLVRPGGWLGCSRA